MSYRKGDLKVRDQVEYLECGGEGSEDYRAPYDARATKDDIPIAFYVELEHSCGEWRIGGLMEIDTMIADLQAARREIRNRIKEEERRVE